MVSFTIVCIVVACLLLYDGVPIGLSRLLGIGAFQSAKGVHSVALTFDDGPDPNYTPRLLDALRDAQIHATFFVIVDKARRHKEIIERMLVEGHEVEIHGYTHACVPLLLPWTSVKQVALSSKVLTEELSVSPRWYRPTWGLINLPAWLAVKRLHLRFVTWSVMVGDWRVTEPDELMRRILRKLRPGSVIVLHDSDETPGAERLAPNAVISLIPDLADQVRSRQLDFVLLSSWR